MKLTEFRPIEIFDHVATGTLQKYFMDGEEVEVVAIDALTLYGNYETYYGGLLRSTTEGVIISQLGAFQLPYGTFSYLCISPEQTGNLKNNFYENRHSDRTYTPDNLDWQNPRQLEFTF